MGARDKLGRTPLAWACLGGGLGTMLVLGKFKARTDVVDNEGSSLLHLAATSNWSWKKVRYLLGKVDATLVDKRGRTALHVTNDDDSVRLLCSCGLEINARDDEGRTLL